MTSSPLAGLNTPSPSVSIKPTNVRLLFTSDAFRLANGIVPVRGVAISLKESSAILYLLPSRSTYLVDENSNARTVLPSLGPPLTVLLPMLLAFATSS